MVCDLSNHLELCCPCSCWSSWTILQQQLVLILLNTIGHFCFRAVCTTLYIHARLRSLLCKSLTLQVLMHLTIARFLALSLSPSSLSLPLVVYQKFKQYHQGPIDQFDRVRWIIRTILENWHSETEKGQRSGVSNNKCAKCVTRLW